MRAVMRMVIILAVYTVACLTAHALTAGTRGETADKITPETAARLADRYAELDTASAARFYNLGNALYLADRLPEATLAYRRGLNLDPNDAGLRDNLEYARARVQSPFASAAHPEVELWPEWLFRPSAWQVLVVSFLLYALAWCLFTRWYVMRRRALIVRAIIVFALAVTGGFYWQYLQNQAAWRHAHPLVVIRADRVPLRKGNGPSYEVNTELPQLARGMEARRLRERGGWLQIQFAGGAVGWVEKATALVDGP